MGKGRNLDTARRIAKDLLDRPDGLSWVKHEYSNDGDGGEFAGFYAWNVMGGPTASVSFRGIAATVASKSAGVILGEGVNGSLSDFSSAYHNESGWHYMPTNFAVALFAQRRTIGHQYSVRLYQSAGQKIGILLGQLRDINTRDAIQPNIIANYDMEKDELTRSGIHIDKKKRKLRRR